MKLPSLRLVIKIAHPPARGTIFAVRGKDSPAMAAYRWRAGPRLLNPAPFFLQGGFLQLTFLLRCGFPGLVFAP
jgi:hypothetical protein